MKLKLVNYQQKDKTLDNKIQIFQVWLYDNTKWVIKNNNTKTEYVSVIPLDKWNDKEGFNYLGIDRS